MSRRHSPRTWLVPGNTMWRARRVKRDGKVVAIRARHRVFPWFSITVASRDLRAGAEAIARELQRRAAERQILRDAH